MSDFPKKENGYQGEARHQGDLVIPFNTSRDMVFVFDPRGIVLDVNRIALQRLGYSVDELKGKSVLLTHPLQRQEEATRLLNEISSGKRNSCPIPLVTKYGVEIPVETRFLNGNWYGKQALLGIAHDVSLDLQLEAEARESLESARTARRQLARLLEAATKIQQATIEREVMDIVAPAVCDAGWETSLVVLFYNWEIVEEVYYGLSDEEIAQIQSVKLTAQERSKRFGPEVDRFLVGHSYFIPSNLQELLGKGRPIRKSRRKKVPGDTWENQDALYIPLRDSGGNILGAIHLDDPTDGQRPTEHSLRYLEFFADIAALKIHDLRLEASREKTDQALKESEHRLRHAQNLSGVGSWSWNLITNKRAWSDELYKIFEMDPAEEITTEISRKFVHPDDLPAFEQSLKEVYEGKSAWSTRRRIIMPDGRIKHLRASTQAELDEQGNLIGMIGAIQDVTESVAMFKQLEESEYKYRSLFENASDGIAITRNGLIEFVNPRLAEIIGYPFREILGRKFIEYIVPEEREKMWEIYRNRLKGEGIDGIYETKCLNNRGEAVPIEINSTLINYEGDQAVLSFLRDVSARKQAEAALAEKEELLRATIESTADGILVVDSAGKVKYANHQFATLWRIPEELLRSGDDDKLLGFVLNQLVDPDAFIAEVKRLYDSADESFDVLRFKDGRVFERYSAPLFDLSNITGRVWSFRDVTARRKAEEAVSMSRERMDLALQGADLGMWDWDITTDTLVWDDRLVKQLGYEPGEIKPNRSLAHMMIHPNDVERSQRLFTEHLEGISEAFECEFRLKTKSGRVKWILSKGRVVTRDKNGRPLRVTGTHFDITEQKNAVSSLRESEQKQRALLDAIPDMMFIIRIDGVIVSYRASISEQMYRRPEEFMGQKLGEVIPPEIAIRAMRALENTIKTGQICKLEYALDMPDQITREYEARVVAYSEDEALFIIRDITETVRLRDLESRAQRLETAGSVAGQVAHDFNNLLGPIMAYPELIRDVLHEDHPAINYLRSIENAARQMSEINQQLLTLGRRGHYNQEPLNLNRIVEQVASDTHALSKTVSVILNLAPDLMNIRGGEAQIYRAVANLINNAVDAIQSTGNIEISTENFYAEESVDSHSRVPQGEYIKLTISDSGCGIPENKMGRIFEPFYTSKTVNKERGSGLGLSVVDGVVKDHCGYIDIASKLGEGTSFYIYFPITREELSEQSFDQIPKGHEAVLIVDDDETQRDVSTRLLQKLGYTVDSVPGGEEAVSLIQKKTFDLLILDMVMPHGIDGSETYRRIQQIIPDQRALIVSGFSETERVVEIQKLGAGAFVRKPLTLSSLALAVRTELDRKQTVDIDR